MEPVVVGPFKTACPRVPDRPGSDRTGRCALWQDERAEGGLAASTIGCMTDDGLHDHAQQIRGAVEKRAEMQP